MFLCCDLCGVGQRSVMRTVLLAALCAPVILSSDTGPFVLPGTAATESAGCDLENHDVVVVLDATDWQRNAACGRDSCRVKALDLVMALSTETTQRHGRPKMSLVLYGDDNAPDDHFRSQLALQTLNDDLVVQAVISRYDESAEEMNPLHVAVDTASLTLLGGRPESSKALVIMSQGIAANNGTLTAATRQLSSGGITVAAVSLGSSSAAGLSQSLLDDITIVNWPSDVAAEEAADRLLAAICNADPFKYATEGAARGDIVLYALDPFLSSSRGRRGAYDLQQIQSWQVEGHVAPRPEVNNGTAEGSNAPAQNIYPGQEDNHDTPRNLILPDRTQKNIPRPDPTNYFTPRNIPRPDPTNYFTPRNIPRPDPTNYFTPRNIPRPDPTNYFTPRNIPRPDPTNYFTPRNIPRPDPTNYFTPRNIPRPDPTNYFTPRNIPRPDPTNYFTPRNIPRPDPTNYFTPRNIPRPDPTNYFTPRNIPRPDPTNYFTPRNIPRPDPTNYFTPRNIPRPDPTNYFTPRSISQPDPTQSHSPQQYPMQPEQAEPTSAHGPETAGPINKAAISAGTLLKEREGTVANKKEDKKQSLVPMAVAVGAAIGIVAVGGGVAYASLFSGSAAASANSAASTIEIA